jgi:aspartate carbamoyltransferase catalytic subunit
MTKAAVSLSGRDILDLSSLSVEEYDLIMRTAAESEEGHETGHQEAALFAGQIHREPVSTKTAPGPEAPLSWPVNTWEPM